MILGKNLNKALAVFVSVCMVIGVMPVLQEGYAYAEDAYVNGNVSITYADLYGDEHINKTYQAKYSDDFFVKDNSEYDIELAEMSIAASMASRTTFYSSDNETKTSAEERDTNVKNMLTEKLKYSDYKSYNYSKSLSDTSNSCAYAFAHKTVNISGEDVDVLAVVIRSGLYNGEWKSNGIVAGDEYPNQHNGFSIAASGVLESLEEYISENSIDTSTVKVWIPGYSRGAAIANILSADLIKKGIINENNMYCYTAATPRTTKEPVEYRGIFNTLNPIDVVPKVPPAYWNYSWYGKVIALPDKTNDLDYASDLEKVKEIFSELSGGEDYGRYTNHFIATEAVVYTVASAVGGSEESYGKLFQNEMSKLFAKYLGDTDENVDYIKLLSNLGLTNGYLTLISGALISEGLAEFSIDDIDEGMYSILLKQHWPETYLAYLKNGKVIQGLSTKLLTISSDANVCIYDKNNKLVGKIKNDSYKNFVESNEETALEMIVSDDGTRKIYVPEAGDYTVKITAAEEGSLNYSIEEIGEDGLTEEKINYLDIPVSKGDTLDAGIEAGNDVDESSYNLTKNDSEVIEPTDILSNEEIGEIAVTANVKGEGTVTGAGQYTKGDNVELAANAKDGYKFKGWYQDGRLLSSESTYSIEAIENDIEITAEFAKVIEAGNVTLEYTKASYTGKSIKPCVTVKIGDKVLKENEDYTLKYEKTAKNVGKHKVVVKGTGDYTGTVTKYYTISPKGTKITALNKAKTGFTVKWAKQKEKMSLSRIDGYQIEYSTSNSFKKSKSVSVKGNNTGLKKIKGIKSGKYYVRIRTYMKVDGTRYYSSWSKSKAVKVK